MTQFRRAFMIRVLGVLLMLAGQMYVAGHARAEESAVPKQSGPTALAENRITSLVSAYKLGAGDVISIRVFGEDDFTKEKIRLNDVGAVSFPAIGEIKVLGLTIGDLERIVVNGLRGRILVNPRVSVQIEEYRPFYVNGMVDKPGGYPYQPGLTVRKAASLAGGFRERASLNKIYIIREDDPAQKPQKAELNTPVGPGDILTVEESFF
jgi:protein involved in polysaccharide export with SLBB domain